MDIAHQESIALEIMVNLWEIIPKWPNLIQVGEIEKGL
jgi:hypothetical protein